MSRGELRFIPLRGMPEVQQGADLSGLVFDALQSQGVQISDDDVLVVTSKVLAKAQGRIVDYSQVEAGRKARALAEIVKRDARELQVMLQQEASFMGAVRVRDALREATGHTTQWSSGAKQALKRMPYLLFFRLPDGRVCTEAGIDESNVPGDHTISLLPRGPHRSAEEMAAKLGDLGGGLRVGVIITDSEIRLLGRGSQDIALGWWGLREVRGNFGREDRHGLPKFGGVDSIVDSIAAACGLLMGQTDQGIPAVLVRGLPRHCFLESDKGAEPAGSDLARMTTRGIYQLICTRLRWRLKLLNPLFR